MAEIATVAPNKIFFTFATALIHGVDP